MIDVGTLVMKVEADTKKFTKGIGIVNKGMDKVGKLAMGAAKTAAVGVAAIGASMGAVAVKSIQMGADAEEALNKYNVVFDGMTDTVDKWAVDFASSVGRSKFTVMESVANLADLQQGLGMTKDESFDLSKQIVELATDLASFNNVQDEDAINALSKAMLGEAESAKELGLLLNVDRVKAYAEAQGFVWKEVTDAQRAQLTYNLALEQSQNAIGDAERSNQSFTNQMKALKTGVGDAVTELGMKLLPMATDVVKMINKKVVPSLGGFIDKALDLGKRIGDFLKPHIDNFIKFVSNNMPTVKEVARNVFEKVQEFAGNVVDFYEDELIPIFDRAKEWWDTNGQGIKDIASDMFEGVKTAAEKVWKFFDEKLLPKFTQLLTWVIKNYPLMKDTIAKMWDKAKTAAEPFIKIINDHVIPAFENLFGKADKEFPNFLKSVEDNFGAAADIISSLGEAIDFVLDGIDKINALVPEDYKTTLEDLTPGGFLKNFGLLPGAPLEYDPRTMNKDLVPYGTEMPIGASGSASMYSEYANFRKGEGNIIYNIEVKDNTIMRDRDADNLANRITDRLKEVNVKR